jgi:hypothetical protein
MAYPDAFLALTNLPSSLEVNQYMQTIGWLVVLMYDRTSTATLVNETRLQFFNQKGRAFDNIPQTQAALLQHVKWAVYQGWLLLGASNDCLPTVALFIGMGMVTFGRYLESAVDNTS